MIAAVVQMTSLADLEKNLERAAHWIECAVAAGAELVALPENFAFLGDDESTARSVRQGPDGPVVRFLREQAAQHRIWLAGGSFAEEIPGESRHHNTALILDPDGEIMARYRKIHLFDVALPDASYRESQGVAPGSEPVVAELPFARVGLSICYDLRFPELYRLLSGRGAQLLLVPAAFTVPTGRDHWDVLLRARAIENQAYVLAPAQYGVHGPRRRSYGRSQIVDPWGVPLATVPDGEGVATARLDFEAQARIRHQLPALSHRRLT